jgi:hypothetical protein
VTLHLRRAPRSRRPHRGSTPASRTATRLAVLLATALVVLGAQLTPAGAHGPARSTLRGRIASAGAGLAAARVTLYRAGSARGAAPTALAGTVTSAGGSFTLSYRAPTPPGAVLYLLAGRAGPVRCGWPPCSARRRHRGV